MTVQGLPVLYCLKSHHGRLIWDELKMEKGVSGTPAKASHQTESHQEVEDCIDCVKIKY